ncbi:DEAD/DEAH box helicase [Desulforhopalus sp. IMCC35007]|uniref:DEAD/DEAH box helicase n=1 Tax=Desulforhopalus sp. IMCC35007 TaxID=2569543 RepID=UPI0010ADDD75|nr:DEAD/DEAH box helicase [Desulforhopalus sp. IMCC35007]TKB05890.1 DEAD/DEAH box helicase [Desulforhopalus sp. IMCC35007]
MSFKEFKFHPMIEAGINACGYTSPTPIQQQTIPPILAGNDILGLAQTGTGKTAAFVLPILQRLLDGPRKKIRALIVAPTRELAEQINENIIAMSAQTGLKSIVVYGGVGRNPQIQGLRSGAEIVVACPGRLLDLLREKGVSLSTVETLVLDEADHMFDKGFLPDIRRIVNQLPRKRQSLVFSATMPNEIRHLAEEILYKPVTVQINHTLPAPTISHALFQVGRPQKTELLIKLIVEQDMTSTVVFTRTKHKAKSLALQLQKAGHKAASLQGNLSQSNRQRAMDGFRDGTFSVLVATDIAARGIDVSGISHVINYDVPDTAETYTHRTGRTGRAEKSGMAITFADHDDLKMISQIERNLGKKMSRPMGLSSLPPSSDVTREQPSLRAAHKEAGPKSRNTSRSSAKSSRKKSAGFDFGINNNRKQL